KSTPIVEITTQTVDEGTTVTFHCHPPSDASGVELHWRRQDETSLSYEATDEDGILTIANVRLTDAGTYICFTEDPETGDRIDSAPASLIVNPITQSDGGSYICYTEDEDTGERVDSAPAHISVIPSEPERKPLADTTIVSIQEGGTVKLHCTISDKESDELHWRREDGGFLPYDAVDSYGVLTIQQAQLSDSGIYICYSEDSITGERIDSTPTKLEVIPVATSEIQRVPVVETPTVTVEQGETIRLRCNIPTKADDIQLHWRREDGRALRWDISEDYGLLIISNVQPSDAGAYICSAEDMETGETIDSAPAYITVNPSALKGVTPHVESTAQSFEEGETITLRCTLPDKANAELHWRR
uniref:Ig-like domain-containing protein n=1 Tax=Parascaris equorum TaxID=6256 RepID=A0A914RX27_PAREQ